MRRILHLSLLALFCLVGSSAWAQTFTKGNLKFTVTDATAKTVSVAKANNDITGDIVIPSTVANGSVTYTVTAVATDGFYSTAITGITIPATVMSVNQRAFQGCYSLSNFTIEDSDKELSLVSGYDGILRGVNTDKTIYVGRNLVVSSGDNPFYANVVSVTFGDKVTSIASKLFYDQNKLHNVVIGKGVKTIGAQAFCNSGDDADTVGELSVTMGENVETICSEAFNSCPKLLSISLPSTLKLIEGYAFSGTGLGSITIPASVDSLGYRAFGSCGNLSSIRIEDSNKPLKLINGYEGSFNYSQADKSVYVGRDLKFQATGSLISVGSTNITSVEFGDKVTNINPQLFYDANKLHSLVIGKGVKTIGTEAFRGAGDDENTVGELSVTMGENVETIGSYAFDVCPMLYSITLPSTLKLIEGYAFSGTGLGSITIPASVDSLGYRAFGSCGNLSSIRIEDSTKPLKLWRGYEGTFNFSNADKSMYIGRDLKLDADDRLFQNGTGSVTSLEFGDLVTTINPYLFKESDKLYSLVIGKGVKTIGGQAFYGSGDDADTVGELSVTMGENVETIGANAFDVCPKLYSINLPSTLKLIEGYAFSSTGLGSITIPASVDSIGRRAFGSCESLSSIRIEDSTKPLKLWRGYEGTFNYSNADKSMYIGRDLKLDADDRLFNNGTGNVTSLEFGDMVTIINPYLFKESDKLYSLVIGKGVKTIGAQAFYGSGDDADTVGELSVTMGENVETIGVSAFDYCVKMTNISLPATLKTIGEWAFSMCSSLGSIKIPGSVTSIGKGAFGNTPLTDITFEDGDKPCSIVLGYDATFRNPQADYTLYLGRNLAYEGNSCPFPNATAVTIGSKVTSLAPNMLNNQKLLSVQVPWPTPIAIQENVFSGTTYNNGWLLVPGGTKAKYAAATGWKNFLNVDTWSLLVTLNVSGHGTISTPYGSASNGNTVQYNQPKDEPIVYTLTADNGYRLSKLTDNGTAVSPLPTLGTAQSREIGSTEESVTLSATFVPVNYTITYDLAGGTMPSGVTNPSTYNAETATFTLNNPIRNYYDFAGWTGTGLTSPTKTVTIAKGNVGNRSYKATWTPKTYTVTISGAGVTASNYSPKYGESVTITIADDPDRTLVKLTVNGTDVTNKVVGGKYTITNVSSNIEVEATFRSTKEFITMTGEYAVFSCPQDLDFSGSDLRAYIASGFNKKTNQVLLTPVTDVPAGTGIFLVGNAGQTYKIPYSTTSSIYMNFFQANLQKSTISATTGSYSNYTFGVQGGDLGFYPISGSTTLQAQTAYLQLPSSFVSAGVKVSVVFEDDIIDGIEDFYTNNDGDATIYDLSGRRLNKAGRGINIVNGKKILVK